jgi:hypothetical protein
MTIDSAGSFLIGELERLDQTLHDPLVAATWGRDVDLREDVTIADEVAFAAACPEADLFRSIARSLQPAGP